MCVGGAWVWVQLSGSCSCRHIHTVCERERDCRKHYAIKPSIHIQQTYAHLSCVQHNINTNIHTHACKCACVHSCSSRECTYMNTHTHIHTQTHTPTPTHAWSACTKHTQIRCAPFVCMHAQIHTKIRPPPPPHPLTKIIHIPPPAYSSTHTSSPRGAHENIGA